MRKSIWFKLWRSLLDPADPMFLPLMPDPLAQPGDVAMFKRWDDELALEDYDLYFREIMQ